MTEPQAELQATANLSPVSPAPVHTAAPFVIPALQNTVDTIDALVAAATTMPAPDDPSAAVDPTNASGTNGLSADDHDDHAVDDSLSDPYDEDDDTDLSAPPAFQGPASSDAGNDDYSETFDSPLQSEDEEEQEDQPAEEQAVSSSSVPTESNTTVLAADQVTTNHPPAASSQEAVQIPTEPHLDEPDLMEHDATASSGPNPVPPGAPPGEAQPAEAPPASDASPAPVEPVIDPKPAASESQDQGVDLQKLVADLTAQPSESGSDSGQSASPNDQAEQPVSSSAITPSVNLPSSASLPPRPPQPQSASPSFALQNPPPTSNANVAASTFNAGMVMPMSGQVPTYPTSGAPGTTPLEATKNHPTLPTGPASTSLTGQLHLASYPNESNQGYPQGPAVDANCQRQWEQFMADERQYMAEAKWDRFPEGSRIFIGNLSSDKVSKRDVFDVFHRYGKLAQISLKSAYGFVQYHTVNEGRQAMEHLQGAEIKGRRIHLEVSRAQEKGKKDRGRSPDRGKGRRGEKHHQGRDDYRPGRNHSPRRNDFQPRDDSFGGRDRALYEAGRSNRGRSRSPAYGRNDRDSCRRRSPSPYGRSRRETEPDMPRRFGADVPDVQFILQPDVSRDFVSWVEGAFKAKGLKTEVMFLHPRFPKDQVIQRQAAEGVYGVVDLDLRVQSLGRIPVQAFDRSGGGNNIRFDQYVDLDPNTAAEVILRAKQATIARNGQNYGAASGYANPYGVQHQQPSYGAGYAHAQHPGSYAAPPLQQQQAAPAGVDLALASLAGQVDNATLQRLLASIQGSPSGPGAVAGGYGVGNAAPANKSQVDIQAILGSLGQNQPLQQHAVQQGGGQYGAGYPSQSATAANGGAGNVSAGGDSAAQVQNIMAQLARYRQ